MQCSLVLKINKTQVQDIFKRNYNNLLHFLEDKEEQKKLVNSGYLREYAF